MRQTHPPPQRGYYSTATTASVQSGKMAMKKTGQDPQEAQTNLSAVNLHW
jgi:hypothetical protein